MCEVGKEPRAPAQAFEGTQRLGEIVDTWRQLIFNQWVSATIIKNAFQRMGQQFCSHCVLNHSLQITLRKSKKYL